MNNLFGIEKISVGECQELTIMSMKAYAYDHKHWVIAWSGGKDSTTTLTLILYLIMSGQLERPESLTVMYADTRMELLPLWISSQGIIEHIKSLNFPWLKIKTVMAPIDRRFLVYILGRGVPPPNNNTLRWCTNLIKLLPMQNAIRDEFSQTGEKVLTITGVRMGESAIRDGRLTMACSKNGAECGQGWYMNSLNNKITATIAPIIHWRVCNVWDWLQIFAPQEKYGGWDTSLLAEVYGGDEAKEINARTGCIGCPLANHDTALDVLLKKYPKWDYLQPLQNLRLIYQDMRKFQYRIRKEGERNQDGSLSKNPSRVGPLTMQARKEFTQSIIDIQNVINHRADQEGMPRVDLLNQEEVGRIKWHWENNIWPAKWSGNESIASELHTDYYHDGSIQNILSL